MRKRDTVRNINKLTALMNAKILIIYSERRGYAAPSSIRIINFENCLDNARVYSYHDYRTQEIVKGVYIGRGIRSLDEIGSSVSLTEKMIKYLLKIATIIETENRLIFNLDAYKMWCEKYNLPISEKVISL